MIFIIKGPDDEYTKINIKTKRWCGMWSRNLEAIIYTPCIKEVTNPEHCNTLPVFLNRRKQLQHTIIYVLDDNNNIINNDYPELFI